MKIHAEAFHSLKKAVFGNPDIAKYWKKGHLTPGTGAPNAGELISMCYVNEYGEELAEIQLSEDNLICPSCKKEVFK
jgi:hypothetical protein